MRPRLADPRTDLTCRASTASASVGKKGDRSGKSTIDTRTQLVLAGDVLDVPLPLGWIETGGWIGDTLVLIHGDGEMAASAFVLDPASAAKED